MSAEAQVSYASSAAPSTASSPTARSFAGETAAAGTPLITVMDTSSLLAKLHLAQAVGAELQARR